jgi:hypothetical protein
MLSSIGTCPDCRFVMLRAGDSFIVDVNDFAKAVVYATDNGASVIQEALGTVDQTAFSRAAIDYAYSHGVLIDRQHGRRELAPPQHARDLEPHAARAARFASTTTASATTSTTFLAFDTCTNYGGQNALSVSATACSSEATGKTAGIAGLVISEGLSLQQRSRSLPKR